MSASPQDPLPPELEDIGRLMREERRQPSALELDELQRRVRRQAGSRSSLSPLVQKGSLLTSRLLITILIAFGIVLSGTGATLAMTSNVVDTGRNMAAEEYNKPIASEGGDVEGETASQEPPIGFLPEGPQSGTKPTVGAGPPRTRATVDRGGAPRLQAVRQQAEQGEEQLPFTGLAAIPILLAGIGLLAGGLVLRRRA